MERNAPRSMGVTARVRAAPSAPLHLRDHIDTMDGSPRHGLSPVSRLGKSSVRRAIIRPFWMFIRAYLMVFPS